MEAVRILAQRLDMRRVDEISPVTAVQSVGLHKSLQALHGRTDHHLAYLISIQIGHGYIIVLCLDIEQGLSGNSQFQFLVLVTETDHIVRLCLLGFGRKLDIVQDNPQVDEKIGPYEYREIHQEAVSVHREIKILSPVHQGHIHCRKGRKEEDFEHTPECIEKQVQFDQFLEEKEARAHKRLSAKEYARKHNHIEVKPAGTHIQKPYHLFGTVEQQECHKCQRQYDNVKYLKRQFEEPLHSANLTFFL